MTHHEPNNSAFAFFRVRFRVVSRAAILIATAIGLFSIGGHSAQAAQLFLFPDPVEIAEGETALVDVRLDTEGESINAAQVVLDFPANTFTVSEVLLGGSVLPIAPEPPFLGTDSVKIVGGAPSGYSGSGLYARLVLTAPTTTSVDRATLDFDTEDTQVLLNDGKATPARLTTRQAEVVFTAQSTIAVTSPSHPDSAQWYQGRTAIFHWEAEPGAQYSYQIARDPTLRPDDQADTPVGDIKFENLGDGIYYFSLTRINEDQNADERGNAARYRVMIDVELPEAFEVVVTKQPEVYGGDFWYAVFTPYDALSGIVRVEIAEVRGDEEPSWYEAASPYALRYQNRSAQLLVRAVDRAGNMYEVSVPAEPMTPQWAIFAGVFLAMVLIVLWRQRRRRREKGAIMEESGGTV